MRFTGLARSGSTLFRRQLSIRARVTVIFAVAFCARAALVLPRAFDYLGGNISAETAFGGSDVPGWMSVAYHLVKFRDLSLPMLGSRPPLFPLSVAIVFAMGGNEAHAALLQAIFGSATAVVGYFLARRLLQEIPNLTSPEWYALLVGLMIAVDPVSLATSITLLGEPLFNFLFAACLLCLTATIQEQKWRFAWLAALWMGLGMLTRPTMGFFWVYAFLMLIPFVKRWWLPTSILGIVGSGVYLGWSWRNLEYAGVFTYSMQMNFQLLFYRAVSAEHLATGLSPGELYDRYIRQLYQSVGYFRLAASPLKEGIWQFFAVTDAQIYSKMGQMGLAILLKYWPYALAGIVVDIIRLFFSSYNLPEWHSALELIYHVALYALALIGAVFAYKCKCWRLLMLSIGPVIYITVVNVAATTTDLRMGSTMMVPIIILSVIGLARTIPYLRATGRVLQTTGRRTVHDETVTFLVADMRHTAVR